MPNLYYMRAFFRKRRRIAVRLVTAFCLCGALIFGLFTAFTETADALENENGVGGGSDPQKIVLEEQLDEDWVLEAEVLVPDVFSKPRMVQYNA